MNFSYVLGKMIELFVIILIGYIANKTKVFDRDARIKVTKLVLNVTLPGTILASVLAQDNLPGVKQILNLILVAILSYVILFSFAFLVPKLLHVSKEQIGIYRFMLAFGNVGFIGYPVTEAIFGTKAIFYTSVFNLPFNLFVYSIGISILTGGFSESRNDIKITWKTFVSPCMIASVLSIIMALCNVKAPKMVGETCTIIGNITTPAALMIIGSSLAEMPVSQMFNNFKIYLFAVFRLFIVPIVTYLLFGLFIKDQMLLGVSVIIAAMPVASNGTMLCLQYHANEELMAQGTFITTVLSIITIPVLALLFH